MKEEMVCSIEGRQGGRKKAWHTCQGAALPIILREQLLPVMIFLDFLEAQDLGNDTETSHSRVTEGTAV